MKFIHAGTHSQAHQKREKEKTERTLILILNADVEAAKAVCMHIHNLCI